MIEWILGIGAAVIIIGGIIVYNGIIRLKNQVDNSWAQIDVQLKRRFDLIPNLIETVKGYVKHEKEVLTNVTKARTEFLKADTVQDKAKADNDLSNTLKSLFAVSENYPTLKANENFLQLQEELAGTESKIAYARQHYNDMVMEFNTKIEVFPTNMFAKMLNFAKRQSFETDKEEKKNIKVQF